MLKSDGFISPLFPAATPFFAATLRSGSSGCFGLSLPASSTGIRGDAARLPRRALVQVGLNCRRSFIGSCKRALGNETLFSDSFGIRAWLGGGSLVDLCGRTFDVGGCLQHLSIFQSGVLGLTEVRQYDWLRRKL
jgi:hypothetical protein